MRDGIMKGECVEADFDSNTLTFRMDEKYYAKAGYFYVVPNTMYEELEECRRVLGIIATNPTTHEGKYIVECGQVFQQMAKTALGL